MEHNFIMDRKVNCPTDNCAAAVIKTPSSNDVRLWKRAREITSKIIKHSEIFSYYVQENRYATSA